MTATVAPPAPKWIRVALWVVQVLLALAYGMAGVSKATQPIADLATKMVWPADVPEMLVRFIGVAELAGALGLILPSLTRIAPKLTVAAAGALALVQVLALGFHISRGELKGLPFNLVLLALAAFVAWGRNRRAPIAAR